MHREIRTFDLATSELRALNQSLHELKPDSDLRDWRVTSPQGAHAIACGLQVPVTVSIDGHVGYYCAGMNQLASVIIYGNAGVGVAENMMSGFVHVQGNASQSAGASGHGGLLVIDGDASARCGISMKGISIVVKGSVGHMSAFMAQAGNLVVCGDAGEALGDSIYEARSLRAGSGERPGCGLRGAGDAGQRTGGTGRPPGAGGEQRTPRGFPALWLRAAALQFPHRSRRQILEPWTPCKDRACGNPPLLTATSSTKSSARPRPAFMTSAAGARNGACPISTISSSSARACPATRWRATAKNAPPMWCWATASPASRST